ncbi:MAG: LPS export ABC transporter periplasmic protein LptC [Pseudomonadota bacterium]
MTQRLIGTIAAFAVVLAGLVWWLTNGSSRAAVVEAVPDELIGEPDLYIENGHISQYDQNGILDYELLAAEIRHFARDTLTRLTRPTLKLHGQTDAPPWNAKARTGFVDQAKRPDGSKEERVYLNRDVELAQRFTDGRYTRLRGDDLYLYPEREYAYTEQGVTIDTDVGRTKAAKLYGFLDQGLINLRANANQRVTTIVLRDQFK